jgi:hypothetical protein
MYRKPAGPETGETRPPAELVYAATDRGRRGNSGLAAFQFFSLPLVAGVAGTVILGPTPGLVALAAAALLAIWWWRRAPHAGVVVLRVEGGELRILSGNKKKERARFALDDVEVELDTKTIQKVQEGGSAIPVMRVLDTTVGPEIDTARIVVVAKGKRVLLTEDFVTHMDASEWFGKIRVFLRKSGWLPADEREPVSEAPPSSDDE